MSRQAATFGLELDVAPPPPQRGPGAPAPAPSPKGKRRIVTPPDHIAPDSHRAHGTRAKYVIERCRCQPCRAVANAYERHRQRAIARPDEVWAPYVPAGPVRQHIKDLAASGIGLKQVAKVSGVSHGALWKLVYGKKGRAPSRRVRPETARRILAVHPRDAADAAKIPAAATWRLLDDLLARGFTKTWIATQLLGHEARSLQIRRDRVRASTARAVADLHRRMEGQEPPPRKTRWSQ